MCEIIAHVCCVPPGCDHVDWTDNWMLSRQVMNQFEFDLMSQNTRLSMMIFVLKQWESLWKRVKEDFFLIQYWWRYNSMFAVWMVCKMCLLTCRWSSSCTWRNGWWDICSVTGGFLLYVALSIYQTSLIQWWSHSSADNCDEETCLSLLADVSASLTLRPFGSLNRF